jgi:dihydrofolate reductase
MSKLIYSAIASLDGYIEDATGNFDWAAPDDEVHAFVNDLERPVRTYLYGRRMYETMVYWDTVGTGPEQPAVTRDFAEIWRAAEKVVYSRTIKAASSAKTRIEREFDAEAIRRLKESPGGDINVGGAELAGQALTLGLVDELHLLLGPVVLGGGKRALPDGLHARLELVDEHRFTGGVVHLGYEIMRARPPAR